jgi:ABC-type sugar transport system ATPase subunit
MTMGTRICIMQAGRTVQLGRPLDIYRRPANTFVASFLGNPPMNLLDARLEMHDGRLSLLLGDARLPVPAARRAAYAQYAGRPLIFGVRPEEVFEDGQGGADHAAMRVRVGAVEPLGAETLLVLAASGVPAELIARVHRDSRARAGDVIDVRLDLSAMHLFDPDTHEVISTD